MKTLYQFRLWWNLNKTGTETTVSYIMNRKTNVYPEFTNESVMLISEDRKTSELTVASSTGGTITFSKRWLDPDSETKTEVMDLKLDWGLGTLCYITQFASDIVDADWTTAKEYQYDITHPNITAINKSKWLIVEATKELDLPTYSTLGALQTAIPTPTGKELVKVNGTMYSYNAVVGQWQASSTGTPTPNATDTTAWIVEIATDTEVANGTDTGWTGATLSVKPSQVKAVNDIVQYMLDRQPVKVATTANITLSWGQTIDWISCVTGDRVLVKDQTTGSQNWIYVVASWSRTRATDFDSVSNTEITLWAEIVVQSGTANAGTKWMLSNTGEITVWTTSLSFKRIFPNFKTNNTYTTLNSSCSSNSSAVSSIYQAIGYEFIQIKLQAYAWNTSDTASSYFQSSTDWTTWSNIYWVNLTAWWWNVYTDYMYLLIPWMYYRTSVASHYGYSWANASATLINSIQ